MAGTLSSAIARAVRLEEPPGLVCAGRTDAGVHALGQVVHVDLPADYDGDLAHALNRQVAPEVVVRAARPAPEGFDARRSATWRRYRYLVWNAAVPDPLVADIAWHVAEPLDLRAMSAAADPLIGEHDFRAFCRRAPGTTREDPIVRRVAEARWRTVAPTPEDPRPVPADHGPWARSSDVMLRFDITAGSFCHQMVRSVTAVLVDAGRGRANAATVMAMLAAGSRDGAPQPAPPHGLCLMAVGYPDWTPQPPRPLRATAAGGAGGGDPVPAAPGAGARLPEGPANP